MEVLQETAVLAAVISDLIERIGSYAGFASLVGLAVLAALYFSQARDVRRLRDWAGRAPERTAEVQSGGRTPEAAAVRTGQPAAPRTVGPAQPVAKPAQAGAPAQAAAAVTKPSAKPATVPGAVPATAAGGAAGAKATPTGAPATAGGAAKVGTPAAAPANSGGATPGAPKQAPAGAAAAATPAGAAASAAGATPATKPAGAPPAVASGGTATTPRPGTGAPAGGPPGTGAKVLPARPAPPRPRPIPAARSGQTTVIPPSQRARERRWTAPRYLALIIAGVIVLGLGGTFGVLALTGGDDKGSGNRATGVELPKGNGKAKSKPKPRRPAAPAIDPSTVTVAVLNGTVVTGLAARLGTQVSAGGFVLGNVATASQQQRAESVVLYRPGQSRQARAVARKLDISQIEPVDSASAALAGAATVVVVAGADKANE